MRVFLVLIILLIPATAFAQFNSGSTGADGALDLTTCPTPVCEVQLPESGVLNYTTVNVPSGKMLRFRFNSLNTPVTMLAQGNVTISGSVQLMIPWWYNNSIAPSVPGPGGYYGGQGRNGFGPGGGLLSGNRNGRWVGNLSLVPLTGGSGGAGGCGGGGAIAIASSTTIVVSGEINADSMAQDINFYCGGGSGAGGAIRLVANSLTISGGIFARGDINHGIIRFEAPQGQINFTGTAIPIAIFSSINPIIIAVDPPTLRIVSIGGYAVPTYSAGRPDRIDLMLPTQTPDPTSVVIQGSNVPAGTPVQLQLSGPSGSVTGCTLTGGPGPVSCVATATGLSRNGVSTLIAVATFSPPSMAEAFNSKGKDRVEKVRLETALGGQSKYVFLRADGSSIDTAKLSAQFLKQFGM